jgi:hypothetical protein
MSPEQEMEFVERIQANGRLALRLGSEVDEPWRIE